jgi:hypothetical protein
MARIPGEVNSPDSLVKTRGIDLKVASGVQLRSPPPDEAAIAERVQSGDQVSLDVALEAGVAEAPRPCRSMTTIVLAIG